MQSFDLNLNFFEAIYLYKADREYSIYITNRDVEGLQFVYDNFTIEFSLNKASWPVAVCDEFKWIDFKCEHKNYYLGRIKNLLGQMYQMREAQTYTNQHVDELEADLLPLIELACKLFSAFEDFKQTIGAILNPAHKSARCIEQAEA